MADLLQITSFSTPHWGRASGLEAKLPDGLVVLYAPNEGGKSSIAEAISLLLTGQALRSDLRRFGRHRDRLQAALTAQLGTAALSVEIQYDVPAENASGTATETVTARVDGHSIDRKELSTRLGGIGRDTYRNYYCVDAERIHEGHTSKADDGLSNRALFGDFEPFKAAEKFKEFGYAKIGKNVTKQGSALIHANSIPALTEAKRAAGSGRDLWLEESSRLKQARTVEENAQSALGALQDEIGQLRGALAAVNLYLELETARDCLRETTVPTDVNRRIHAGRESIRKVLGDLETARTSLTTAESKCNQANEHAGDWKDLPAGVDTKETTIERVRISDAAIGLRRTKHDDAKAKLHRAEADGRPPAEGRSAGDRLASRATALGLVVVALVLAISGQGIPAVILGVAGAALLWRLSGARPAKQGSDPGRDLHGDRAEAESRLQDAVSDRNDILLAAGIPAALIPDNNEPLASRLQDLANLKARQGELESIQTKVDTLESDLIDSDFFPEGTEFSAVATLLAISVETVSDHTVAKEAVADKQLALQTTLGGKQTPEEQLLQIHDRDGLQTILDTKLDRKPDFSEEVEEAMRVVEERLVTLASIEVAGDLQRPLLEIEAVRATIREKTVEGLAHLLAADLLRSSAKNYLGDNGQELLRTASGFATRIADGWSNILHDPESDELRVVSTNGDHPGKKLSTGGRSLLNLTLRLATITVESEKIGVRLPVILDDPLAHLDYDRRRNAFRVLDEFAREHQVLYFTCHEEHAKEAAKGTASVIDLTSLRS